MSSLETAAAKHSRQGLLSLCCCRAPWRALACMWRNAAEGAVFSSGVELLQPSTALAGLALFALLYSALARMWSARRAPLKQILDKHPLPHEEEAQLQASFLACTTRHEADATDSQPVHVRSWPRAPPEHLGL